VSPLRYHLHHNPVLCPVMMILERQLRTRFDGDPLDLVTRPAIDAFIVPPRPGHLRCSSETRGRSAALSSSTTCLTSQFCPVRPRPEAHQQYRQQPHCPGPAPRSDDQDYAQNDSVRTHKQDIALGPVAVIIRRMTPWQSSPTSPGQTTHRHRGSQRPVVLSPAPHSRSRSTGWPQRVLSQAAQTADR
jgi:hypothetical protein